jgi:hypothetical protein
MSGSACRGGTAAVRRRPRRQLGRDPTQVSDIKVEAHADSFRVAFKAFHGADGSVRWRGELVGSADGTLDCRLDGVAESDFEYNRIGFCVLHPRENAGRPYNAGTDGELTGTLPDLIGAQRFEDGKI